MQEQERALISAAAETIRRVNRDARMASPRIKPILLRLERCFRDEGFNATPLRRALSDVSNNLRQIFRAELGQTLSQYITGARLETGSRLLRDTDLSLGTIALLVGYSDTAPFRSAFKRWFNLLPSQFRTGIRRAPDQNHYEYLSVGFFRSLDRECIDNSELSRLIDLLKTMYPDSQDPAVKDVDWWVTRAAEKRFRKRLLESIWEKIEALPFSEREAFLRHEIRFDSSELFHFLGEKSRIEGRKDRLRGIEVAKLALVSLEASAESLCNARYDLRALGWARLAQARQLALDKDGAEADFSRSDAAWRNPKREHDRRVEAEINSLKGTLRLYQRRFEDARDLLNRAVAMCRETGATSVLIKSLIQRARVVDYLGDYSAASADLQVALQLLAASDEDSYLTLVSYTNLAASYTWAQDLEQARSALEKARFICQKIDNPSVYYQLQWIRGLVSEGATAERLFREARRGFVDLGELDHAAMVALELAVVCQSQGHRGEAMSFASEAILVFESLESYSEAAGIHSLLSNAVAESCITLTLLKKAQSAMHAIFRNPTSPFGCGVI